MAKIKQLLYNYAGYWCYCILNFSVTCRIVTSLCPQKINYITP